MEATNPIPAAMFSAFTKCATKAHLLAIGEPPPDTFFAEIRAHISSSYKAAAKRSSRADIAEALSFGQLSRSPDNAGISHHVDCETANYDFAPTPRKAERRQPRASSPFGRFVPVLYLPWEKPELSDILLVSFGALALSQATGILPEAGTLICGDSYRRRTVRIEKHVARTRQIINAIQENCQGQKAPPLLLNRHCAVCDFQPRCRNLAIERDDLSLLTAMTSKERAKINAKGISTITQLSYGYRPRRRKRTRPDAKNPPKSANHTFPVVKNDHKLKALAIKKSQIHVVGSPSPKFDGIPIFLDVEGMPDRDFYYLIGLRFQSDGETVERSFWANGPEDERIVWQSCLQTIKAIENPQVVSYGAYEARFLRQMKARYTLTLDDSEFVDRLIETSVNLVGCIYGKVYFPTFSNSLKEVGRYLGFDWAWPQATGAATPLLRRAWELDANDESKRRLIDYNMDDCRAAAAVADLLKRICVDGTSGINAVAVGSLEVGFQRTFGKFESALPEFTKINNAAYWDYQRSKVYTRTDKTIKRVVQKTERMRKSTSVEEEVTVKDVPEECPKCHAAKFWTYRGGSTVVYDLRFTRRGIKRWAVRYHYCMYQCSKCRGEKTVYLQKSQYGPNLRAFVV